MTDEPTFEGWAILELMGHRRLAGHVREVVIAGAGFLRLDVFDVAQEDEDEHAPVATQFYPPTAVYCLTPTTEAIARRMGARARPEPVARWELTAPLANADPNY